MGLFIVTDPHENQEICDYFYKRITHQVQHCVLVVLPSVELECTAAVGGGVNSAHRLCAGEMSCANAVFIGKHWSCSI